MSGLIKKIIDILSLEKEIYKDILILSQKRNDAIIKCDINLVEKIDCDQAVTLKSLKIIEKDREDIVRDIAEKLNILFEDICISKLKDYCSESEWRELSLLQKEILEISEKLQNINNICNKLIKSQLDLIDHELKYMVDNAGTKTYDYQGSKAVNRFQAAGLLDQKA